MKGVVNSMGVFNAISGELCGVAVPRGRICTKHGLLAPQTKASTRNQSLDTCYGALYHAAYPLPNKEVGLELQNSAYKDWSHLLLVLCNISVHHAVTAMLATK